MTDLKPCPNPWCNKSDPVLRETANGQAYVECRNCLSGPPCPVTTNAEAILAWNTRPAPRVKPLEWVKSVNAGRTDCCHTDPLDYVIRGPFPDGHFIWMSTEGKGFQEVPTLEAAKAAAQADYAARILSALVAE